LPRSPFMGDPAGDLRRRKDRKMREELHKLQNPERPVGDPPARNPFVTQKSAGPNFRPREAAEYLRVSVSWLNKKRVYGGGPRYHKFGRSVIYSLSDLDDFVAGNARNHTSESL
jgi:hypothetical protein